MKAIRRNYLTTSCPGTSRAVNIKSIIFINVFIRLIFLFDNNKIYDILSKESEFRLKHIVCGGFGLRLSLSFFMSISRLFISFNQSTYYRKILNRKAITI